MQRFVLVVIALVVGILLGAWQPRGEVLALRAQLDQMAAPKPCRTSAASEVQGLLHVKPSEPTNPPPIKEKNVASPDVTVIQPPDVSAPSPSETDHQSAAEEMETMVAGLEARRAQSMAALVEQAGLNSEQEKAAQAIYDQMNADLKVSLEQFIEKSKRNGKTSRRDMMELGSNVLDIMVTTDDALHQQLPAEALEGLAEEVTDPFAFVSGEVVRPMIDLQDVGLE